MKTSITGTDSIIARDGQDCRRLSVFRQATLNWNLPREALNLRT